MQDVPIKLNPGSPLRKQHSTGRRLYTSKLDVNLRKKQVKCYTWSMAPYGVETWKLQTKDQKYLESFETWYWRRMEEVSCTNHVTNEKVLHKVKEEKNILHTKKRRKPNWIGHI
jgi:rhamnogalacturonyl hydrolase YesR